MKMESVGAFHSTQNSGNFGWYIKINGTGHFGLVQLEYLILALKVVHFDRSDHFSWSKRKCSSPFDKIVVPSTALLNPTYKEQ